ncbi:MAG: DEAD/DEAH box helicase family protein [Sulfurimonas sp.]|nr:DEAD/DEAH box helicase family protein [Sulfurimonas sp.]
MKIQFESDLGYQDRAIASIVDIFEGQEICQSNFSIVRPQTKGQKTTADFNDLGIGNRLELLDDEILANVQKIQLRNGLPQSKKLTSMDFSIEMETGTGKTYVYLKSIFEMNKRYGFTKFIIVVPSIAIKEGTKKTLEITSEHFKTLFDNVNYDSFIYDSSNLEQVRDFATSSDIRIMVINIDAFRKSFTDPTKNNKANIIHRENDRLNGQKPIEFIASTNPILIIDEPQSVANTPKAKEAIETLNPLCRLRYSATHIEKFNLMYKLDSIDAYEQQLVKQIEVANVKLEDTSNRAYIRLVSVKANPRSAKIEIYVIQNGSTKRKIIVVKSTDDLYEKSNGRDVYDGYTINDIYIEKGSEYIEFLNQEVVRIGETVGDADDDCIKRLQVRKTIEEHLDKELRLKARDIKVLSLFFIDRVANYRSYDEKGNEVKGKYALWFEEEFKIISKKPKYNTLFGDVDIATEVEKIHDGYFAQDSKGRIKDSTGKNKDDESAFDKIMKNKETLLSFSEPLRFIFSHSALKEGWDNPNVFQICTLNETNSVMKKRQEIGRGLRICVNQDGQRVRGFDVNTLTVMANESYVDFAKGLQNEYEKDCGITFEDISKYVKDANDKKLITLNKEVYLSEEFKALWEQIKYKTTYRVDFDVEKLVKECAKHIANDLTVGKIKYLYSKATNKITKAGVEIIDETIKNDPLNSEIIDFELPDIVTYLQNETNLTRRNIVDILIKSGKLQGFKNNPQKFIDGAIKIIKKVMSIFIVDGIKYQKLGNEFYYSQQCFEDQELYGYLSSNMIENRENKSIYTHTVYDSTIEENFAIEFNRNEKVKLFTKLPKWFKINTPLGTYNPDWAVMIVEENEEKLYFVVESKGSDLGLDIKTSESSKIECAKKHFAEISTEVKLVQSDNFRNFSEHF